MKTIDSYIPHGGGFINNPNRIIVHAMGENIGDGVSVKHAVAFLNDIKLSAHILVSPNGDVYRCRADNEIAYHAKGHNTNTLGIEFLVQGSYNYSSFLNRIKTPYVTSLQIESGIEVIRNWIKLYNIKSIVRHSDVSPERKVDPDIGFPWEYLLNEIREGT